MQSHKLSMTTLLSSYTLYEITCYDICFVVLNLKISRVILNCQFSIHFFAYLVEVQ
jgi:hypothetical protein